MVVAVAMAEAHLKCINLLKKMGFLKNPVNFIQQQIQKSLNAVISNNA
jgi:hypothetical protein